MMKRLRKIKISDVAREAGVSTTTVSRVINDAPTVKRVNKIKVEEAIRRLKYRPDVSARRLAGGRSNTIGLVIPRFEDMFHSFYASEIIKGVGECANNLSYDLLLHITSGRSGDLFSTNIFNASFVGGILFADVVGNEELIKIVREEKIPYLIMNYYSKKVSENCIGIDNRTAAIDVVNYLVRLGHRRIATITGKLWVQSGQDRLEGFKEALKLNGVELDDRYIVQGDWTGNSGREGMRKLLSLDPRPTAIFVAGDEMAVEVVREATRSGLRVPQDISIIGFDDIPLASFVHPPLTTVHQPLAELGKLAVETLGQILLGKRKAPAKILLSIELIERKSAENYK